MTHGPMVFIFNIHASILIQTNNWLFKWMGEKGQLFLRVEFQLINGEGKRDNKNHH